MTVYLSYRKPEIILHKTFTRQQDRREKERESGKDN